MPNGDDKNFVRLRYACSAFRAKYGEWPVEARMHPGILWDLARLFEHDDFVALGTRVRLRTRDEMTLSVGSHRGVMDYADVKHELVSEEQMLLVDTWLGVAPGRSEH